MWGAVSDRTASKARMLWHRPFLLTTENLTMTHSLQLRLSTRKSFSSLNKLVVAGLLAGFLALVSYKYMPYKALYLITALPLLLLSLTSFIYFIRFFRFIFKEKKLIITSKMILDEISIHSLKEIPFTDIRKIYLKKFMGIEFIQIHIHQNAKCIKSLKEPKKFIWEIYTLIFNHRIFIPLVVFKYKKQHLIDFFEDLEIQFYLSPNFLPPKVPAYKKRIAIKKPIKEAIIQKKKKEKPQNSSVPSIPASSHPTSYSEEEKIRQKVMALKEEVYELELDRYLFNFFKYINNSELSPEELNRALERPLSYFKIKRQEQNCQIEFEQEQFQYELRFEFDKRENYAHLSLYINGGLKLGLILEIDIGGMSISDIAHYHKGNWSKLTLKLLKELESSLNFLEETAANIDFENTTYEEPKTQISDLKKRFNI